MIIVIISIIKCPDLFLHIFGEVGL